MTKVTLLVNFAGQYWIMEWPSERMLHFAESHKHAMAICQQYDYQLV